jgi:hypothetical protein
MVDCTLLYCRAGKEGVITSSQLPEGMGTVQQIERMEDAINRYGNLSHHCLVNSRMFWLQNENITWCDTEVHLVRGRRRPRR